MAQQTINVGTSPNDGAGTPLRTAFQYTNSNFSELYTAVGPSGNNIVVPGSATITGDLTVRTNKLKVDASGVGVGTATTSTGGGAMVVEHASNNGLIVNSTAGSPTIYLRNVADANPAKLFFTDNGLTFANVTNGTLMTLNSTGLGVGASPSFKLHVQQTLAGTASAVNPLAYIVNNGSGNTAKLTLSDAVTTDGNITLTGSATAANRLLGFGINGVQQMVLDGNGNVGIGVTPSASSACVNMELGGYGATISARNTSSAAQFAISSNAVGNWYAATYKINGYATQYAQQGFNGTHAWYIAPSGTAGNAITFTQAMTLDASGNLNLGVTSSLINTTRRLSVSGTVAAALQSTGAATVETINVWHTATSGNNIFVDFDTEAAVTSRGSISYNRAGGLVAYNTTSDYRAKDIIGPVSNSGSLIDSLKVYVGKMKGATIERPMLIAHETQEVAPYAVTGTKDEVDADGKPKYQQMDASALVPLLIAEIQSLRTRVQTLETR